MITECAEIGELLFQVVFVEMIFVFDSSKYWVVTKGFNPKVCAIFSKSEFLVNSFPAKIIFFPYILL